MGKYKNVKEIMSSYLCLQQDMPEQAGSQEGKDVGKVH